MFTSHFSNYLQKASRCNWQNTALHLSSCYLQVLRQHRNYIFTKGLDTSAFLPCGWVNKPWRESQNILDGAGLRQQLKWRLGQILAASFIWKRGLSGFGKTCWRYRTTWEPLITNSSAPLCFLEMYLMCFCLMHTVCLYLAIQNSHLHFVPAVRLSLWVHRVWRTRLTMEGGGSQQSRHMHRPPRSSPRHSVQWVSLSSHFVLKYLLCK